MSATEAVINDTPQYTRYDIVAWANREKSVYYAEFGSYQGEWILLSKGAKDYRIYEGYYGSCSGCDSLEATSISTRADAEAFAKDYPPFAEVPFTTMQNLVNAGTLMQVMPRNVNDTYGETNYSEAVVDMAVAVKLEEGLPLTAQDVIKTRNQEIKQRALKAFGYERFVDELEPIVLDVDGENQLLKVDGIVFAYVKDSSTPRRYLLRVPPNFTTVKAAIAWTFGMTEAQYQPLIET